MAQLLFSGVEKQATASVLASCQATGMMSFLQYSPRLFAACESFGLPLVMDSGAYSKTLTRTDIERYAQVITSLGDACLWYANPDVIGDQQRSNENHSYLCSLLPEHLHEKILWVYQSSAPLRYLEEGLERYSRIGVGGLVPLFADRRKRDWALATLIRIAYRIADRGRPGLVPHYFGIAQPRTIRSLYRIHRGAFTCDSSTWLIGSRFGRLVLPDGRQISGKPEGLTPQKMLVRNVETMQRWMNLDDEGIGEKEEQEEVVYQNMLFA